jgi:hypothetical protein
MFFDPACVPCIIRQAYNSAKLITNGDKELQLKIIKEVCAQTAIINENFTAPMFTNVTQAIIEKYSGNENPYKFIKEENLKKAKELLPFVQNIYDYTTEKLEMAIRIAIAGNIIDFGANPDFDLHYEVNNITSGLIEISAINEFRADLKKSKLILYIGDNYEEALFDKFLLKELLPRKVVFAVRSKAVLNDITLSDAENLGINKICEVVESGSTIAGTDLNKCNKEFLTLFEKADMVIAKGQGNFETLIDEKRPIYFLFKVKCDVIAEKSGFPFGRGALLNNQKKGSEFYEKI